MHIASANRRVRPLLRPAKRRQQQRRKDGNDRYGHQKLNERESARQATELDIRQKFVALPHILIRQGGGRESASKPTHDSTLIAASAIVKFAIECELPRLTRCMLFISKWCKV